MFSIFLFLSFIILSFIHLLLIQTFPHSLIFFVFLFFFFHYLFCHLRIFFFLFSALFLLFIIQYFFLFLYFFILPFFFFLSFLFFFFLSFSFSFQPFCWPSSLTSFPLFHNTELKYPCSMTHIKKRHIFSIQELSSSHYTKFTFQNTWYSEINFAKTPAIFSLNLINISVCLY